MTFVYSKCNIELQTENLERNRLERSTFHTFNEFQASSHPAVSRSRAVHREGNSGEQKASTWNQFHSELSKREQRSNAFITVPDNISR